MARKIQKMPENVKPLSSREKLTILGKLIVDTCSHEEIDMLCVGLLHANLVCKGQKFKEQEEKK